MRAFLLVLFLAAAPAAFAENRPESLCQPDEVLYFSARMGENGEMVSVCGNADPGKPDAWIEYRRGKGDLIRTRLPADRGASPPAFTIRRYTRPRTTYLKLEVPRENLDLDILEFFDADADPGHGASLRLKDGEEVLEDIKLKVLTEPLTMTQLEEIVTVAEFDE